MDQPGKHPPIATPNARLRRPRPLPAGLHPGRALALLALLLALLLAPLPAASSGTIHAAFTPLLSWVGQGIIQGGEYGYAVAGAGDVDGDGYDDLVLGARRYTATEYREGVAMLFYGSPGGLDPWRLWSTAGGQSGARYGSSVASAGDVNGDGYHDVLVGAEEYTANYSSEGRAYLFLGSSIGLNTLPAWTFDGDQKDARLGTAVASAGDLNGDNHDDVIIGAPRYTAGYDREGAAFIFYGSPDGLSGVPDLILTGGKTNAFLGASAASAGDVNGDGYDDVVIGAPQYADGATVTGAAFILYGSPDGLSAQPDLILTGDQPNALFGASASSAGDINGDGYDDVIVGAPLYDDTLADVGAVFVFLGSAHGLTTTPHQIIASDGVYSRFGDSVASLGDLGQDGFADIIVGAPLFSFRQEQRGAILIFFGSPHGLYDTPAWRAYGDKAGALFGHAVASAGDVDDDGFPDFAVGSPGFKTGGDIVGSASLYLTRFGELPFRLFVPLVLNSPH